MFPQFPEGCQGKPFREVYQLNKKLKSGTFSTVCRGVHRVTGRQVAVKCILRKKIEPSVDAAVFEEVLIMSGLHHRYICPMIDYFEEDRCHFVVMELEKGGDLCERINEKVCYAEPDAMIVVRNICEAMEFVHDKGFAHCDIKPRNYLLHSKKDDLDVRLADFGFAQHVHAPNSLTSQCGTPFFVAPEVINRKPYDQKVDMWSIGVTAYLLLCGETPFNGKNRQQLFRRISCDDPTFPDDKWGHISDEAVDFVRKLLTKDPAKRLSATEALRHRWLADGKHHRAKSHEKVVDSSEEFSELTETTKRSRDPPDVANHNSNNAIPRSPNPRSSSARASSSRSSRPPPPPPPPHAGSKPSEDDEKARLLEVIKEQDAKIERLERMVMRMMGPNNGDEVHKC
jgi:calcium/calmodulin-dependent protein kinase I